MHYVTTSTVSTSIVTNTPYTMSIWVKLPTFGNVGRYIQLAFGTPRFGTNAYMNYDLGSVPASVGNGGASITNATITAYNDGWYRLTATATSIAQGINPAFQIGFATSINSVRNETTIVPESNQKTIWIYGPQMERGSCATSFILTRTSGTTRQADRYDFDSTDFFTVSGLQGTFYLRGTVINPTATVSGSTLLFAFMEDNGFAVGTSPSIDVGIAAANSNRPFLHAFVSTNTDVDISVPLGAAVTDNVEFTLSASYSAGDYRISRKNLSATSTFPDVATTWKNYIQFGNINNVSFPVVWYKEFKFFPFRVPDSQQDIWSAT